MAFSPDGRQLAAGSDGAVKVWDWKNHQLLHTFAGHDKACDQRGVQSRRAAPGVGELAGKRAALGRGGRGRAAVHLPRISRSSPSRRALAFSPDGGRLATASFDRRVDVWDTTTGELLHTLPHNGLVLCVAFSPDGRRLASAGEDKTVHVWDATTGREVLGLRGHTGMCGCVAFSPDGRRLASASMDGTIRIWDATPLQGHEGQETLTFTQHSDEIWSVAVSPDGQKIVSAGFGTPAKVWDAQTGQVSVEFSGHTDVVFCVAWQPDGQRIASAGADGGLFTVKVWDAADRTRSLRDSRAGRRSSSPWRSAPTADTWSRGARTEPCKSGMRGPARRSARSAPTNGQIRGVVFSRDGRHLASASSDGVVKLWDATRLDEKQERPPHSPRRGSRAVFERGVQPGRPAAGDGGRGEHGQDLGRARPARSCKPSGDTTGTSTPWPSAPTTTADGSPRRARTAP